ncbi:MAG: hypothetical protein IKJ63_04910 [Clostridia bacterium]|nr:hypothetical protein [Clostridia bacterium]
MGDIIENETTTIHNLMENETTTIHNLIENETITIHNLFDDFCKECLSKKTTISNFDITALPLDELIENKSLSEILPIFSKSAKAIKLGKWFIEKYNFKKMLIFLIQLQNGNRDEKGLDKRNKAYIEGKKWFYREVEQTIVYLNRAARIEKVKIIGELYRDLINDEIKTEEYGEYLDIVDQLFIQDIPHLLEIYDAQKATATLLDGKDFLDCDTGKNFSFQSIRCRRLQSIGLLIQHHPMSFGFSSDDHFTLSEYGIYFCEIIHRIDNLKSEYEFK